MFLSQARHWLLVTPSTNEREQTSNCKTDVDVLAVQPIEKRFLIIKSGFDSRRRQDRAGTSVAGKSERGRSHISMLFEKQTPRSSKC